MEAGDRFNELVASAPGGADDVRLDIGALCIAAHAHPGLVVDEWLARLDDLAAGCADSTFASLLGHLFSECGFGGDTEHYDDPENSFLDAVLTRRRGIPITLSVLVIEVARRLGMRVLPVGMPGHFLVREAACADRWCDPFHGGRLLDADDCRDVFDSVYMGARSFAVGDLDPTPHRQVLARMLANLENGELARDPVQLVWMCELHLAIPGVSMPERIHLLRRLARVVDPLRAARAYETAAESAGDEDATRLRAEARLLRSRLN